MRQVVRLGRPEGWRRWAIAVLSVVTAVVVVLTVTGRMPGEGAAAGPASPSPTGPAASPAPAVLDPAGDDAPEPDDAGLAAVLRPLLRQPALGPRVGVSVVDVASGEQVFGQAAGTPAVPASTAKLLTTTAALVRLGPEHRLRTTVVAGAQDGQVVLVGGGDPTLAASPKAGQPWASLPALASQTATALRSRGVATVTLGYDDSLFAPPATAAQWPPGYVSTGIVAPVTALEVDEARTGPPAVGTAPRSADPSAAAARAFAAALTAAGVRVTGTPARVAAPATGSASASASSPSAGSAPAPGTVLGSVSSPPMATLVSWTLSTSDNDLAEALARHVAIAAGRTADFAGGSAAVRDAVGELGLPVADLRLYDGSGLAAANRARPELVARLLATAASEEHPELRSVVTGLSVAGFTGTLEERFGLPLTARAAGLVRGKTGTLTGVSALAGTVLDADGRALSFAFLADAVPAGAVLEARAALDRLATAVTACGCRAPSATPSASATPSR